jgi:hypothetical protein
MAAPFTVEGATPGSQVWGVDAAGNTVQSGNSSINGTTISGATVNNGTITNNGPATYTGTATFNSVIVESNGINTSGSVNVLVGTQTGAGGTTIISTQGTGGTQLSDTTRDYMQYWECTTTGGATIVIGSAQGNAVGIATIFVGSVLTAGTSGVISFRTPAGWYTRFTGTTAAFANPIAISC